MTTELPDVVHELRNAVENRVYPDADAVMNSDEVIKGLEVEVLPLLWAARHYLLCECREQLL